MEINDSYVEATEVNGVKHYKYFACTCSDKDREFWDNAIKEYGSEEHVVSGLIMDLECTFNAWVSNIAADMWFGISVNSNNETLYIECDAIEYGLLCAVKILEQIYGRDE